jgi:erythromycin esterase-like protein
MRRTRRTSSTLLALALVAALTSAVLPVGASAVPPSSVAAVEGGRPGDGDAELPPDWSLEPGPAGPVLVWSNDDVRMGGARPEFRLGERVVGFARETDEGLALPLAPEQQAAVASAPDQLEVWSAGRRLDVPPTTVRPPRRPLDPARTPTSPADPAEVGTYRTERLSYDLEPLVLAGYPEPIEVLAEVTRPVDARGRRPLVLILHGRHSTCFTGGPDGDAGGGWPCPEGWESIPSHLGYRYLTDVLASQGYLAVSIAANGINGQDGWKPDAGTSARSQLIRHHLELWARWSRRGGDPWGGIFRHRVATDEVVLVGHSRGGEGANRAAVDAIGESAYRIRGLVSYGPTAFSRQVTPDVPSAVLLPACDGDVSDLQGQAYVDWSRDLAPSDALRSAVLALGANHNYFNTEWTPGLAQAPAWDDWHDPGDPVCGDEGSHRLSIDEQQQVGAAYTLALVRLALRREAAMLPFLDGTKVKPASIGPAEVSVSPVGGASSLRYRPEDDGTPEFLAGMTGRECPGYLPWYGQDPDGEVASPCAEGTWAESTPHWQPMYGADTRPAPMALELTWDEPASAVRFPLGTKRKGVDLSRERTLDLRVANDPAAPPAALQVRLHDAAGRSAVLGADLEVIEGWPGTDLLDRIQARTLRADLRTAGKLDLRRVTAVDLVATDGPGRVWVLDLTSARPEVTAPEPLALPRVSVATVQAPEGGAGDAATVDVEVRVEGRVRTPATVWVQLETTGRSQDQVTRGFGIELRKGAKGVVTSVPLSFVGDDLWDPFAGDRLLDGGLITLASLTGALTADHLGGVTTIEDEEPPVLSVDAADVTGTEGDVLEWTLRLSGPTTGAGYTIAAVAPDVLTELDSDDVEQEWLQDRLWWLDDPDLTLPLDPPLPLSEIGRDVTGTGLHLHADFGYGETEVVLDIPLRFDHQAEDDEATVLALQPPWEGLAATVPPGGLQLTGTVPAHAADEGLPGWAAAAVPIPGTFGTTPDEEAAIDAIVGDARIVLAGEVSRGAAQAVEARTALIADLVERHGVGEVPFDESLARSVAAARYVALGEGTAEEAVRSFSDELRRTVEAVATLETLRAMSVAAPEPLLVLGLDPGGEPARLVRLVEADDPDLAETISCFDLYPEGVGDWHREPEADRILCREALLRAREVLAAKAASVGRDGAGFGTHVAHAAAVALLSIETAAAVDPASDGYAETRANLRAEALADGILGALVRRPEGRVVAALDDLDAAVLEGLAEPRALPAPSPDDPPELGTVTVARSTGAVLVEALGDGDVASMGITAGRGGILAYYSDVDGERWLYPQPLDRPVRGSLERALSGFGPDAAAFVLTLAGQADLADEVIMRIGMRDEYRSWQPEAWYVPVRPADAFDGLIHLRRVQPTSLLGLRPSLELDGVPVEGLVACYDGEGDVVELTFDGGSLAGTRVFDDEWLAWLETSMRVGDTTYTGRLPVAFGEGWRFAGELETEGGPSVHVAGFVPYDLPTCGWDAG